MIPPMVPTPEAAVARPAVGGAEIEAAWERIRDHVRETPVLRAQPLRRDPTPGATLWLKLENLQVTGSFKARGATNKLLSLPPSERSRGLVTASGGNHGLGVAYAGSLAGAPVVIYLPANTPPGKADKLERWGARVRYAGEVWDDANAAALAAAERESLTYVHPFADPAVIAGQGTVGLEILRRVAGVDLVLVAIGGGGLISGVATAIREARPAARIVGVEPVGAPTLSASLAAGRVVELAEITTRANTLAPRRSAEINLEIIERTVDDIVLVDDDEMLEAARWLWFELGIAAELSGAAAVAALLAGRVAVPPGGQVCALVCGAGTDGVV
jgi:threonine dehydratase